MFAFCSYYIYSKLLAFGALRLGGGTGVTGLMWGFATLPKVSKNL